MKRFTLGTIEKTEENKNFYNRKGYTMTGETITETVNGIAGEESTTYIIFKGSWTRSFSVRDCGDHFIIARYSRYDRINKSDFSLIVDVEDK